MTFTADHDEYNTDRSDWDDLGSMSDQHGWEDGMADAADWEDDCYEDAGMEFGLFGDD